MLLPLKTGRAAVLALPEMFDPNSEGMKRWTPAVMAASMRAGWVSCCGIADMKTSWPFRALTRESCEL